MHPMRRKDRKLEGKEARSILQAGEYGVLSTVGEDGQPYGVPLSFVLKSDTLYFHCAKAGHKLENLRFQPRVAFCVVGKTQPVFEGGYTTCFESAIAFGTAAEVKDTAEKLLALRLLCEKYLPGSMQHFEQSVARSLAATAVWRIEVQEISGKAKRARPE